MSADEQVQPGRPREAQRCAWCHAAFEEGLACPACAVRLHEACWQEARGVCPTLGCGRTIELRPTGPLPWVRRAVIVGVVVLLAVGFGSAALRGAGIHWRGTPCAWHVSDVEPLLGVADRLMADRARHGRFGVPLGQAERVLDPGRASPRLQTFTGAVPPELAPWRPTQVQVGPDDVTLTWDGPGFVEGYSLILVSERLAAETASALAAQGGARNVRLGPRAWSSYALTPR